MSSFSKRTLHTVVFYFNKLQKTRRNSKNRICWCCESGFASISCCRVPSTAWIWSKKPMVRDGSIETRNYSSDLLKQLGWFSYFQCSKLENWVNMFVAGGSLKGCYIWNSLWTVLTLIPHFAINGRQMTSLNRCCLCPSDEVGKLYIGYLGCFISRSNR